MRSLLRLALFLLLASVSPVMAQESPANDAAGDALAGRVSRLEADAVMRERVANAERRSQILEAKSELEDKAYDRFAIIMAGLGVVITLLVVAFGIFTHRSAVSAARQEIADLKDKVQSLHDEAATAKESALEAAQSAEVAAQGAQAYQQTAQEASEKVKEAAALAERLSPSLTVGEQPRLTQAERETVADAAKEVAEKPEREWTVDEFKVKILQAETEENWEEVLRLAGGLNFLGKDNPAALVLARFYEAFATSKLRGPEEGAKLYEGLIARYAESDEPIIREHICTARFNYGFCLSSAKRYDDAIRSYSDVAEIYGGEEGLVYQDLVAKALINKGFRLAILERYTEALATLDGAIARFETSNNDRLRLPLAMGLRLRAQTLRGMRRVAEAIAGWDSVVERFGLDDAAQIREQVEQAHFWKARTWAAEGKIKASIAALERWKVFRGNFDCEAVADGQDFDAVRTRPAFARYLIKQGCPT